MKIAVYTITLNEEKHIKRWANSAKDADLVVVCDTGSTDDTVNIAKSEGCEVHSIFVKPWRFDDARNASLAILPNDIDFCIALDADEILVPGWRNHFETLSQDCTRPRYNYIWSWENDGVTPSLTYSGDKIHKRFGYRWKHPVHEVLTPYIDEKQEYFGLEIQHHPDNTKPRSQYFPLLELAAKEQPQCDRTAHYLAREYFFNQRYSEAAAEFKRHLSLESSVWGAERARSMRYLSVCEPNKEEYWLLRALSEDPFRRETLCDLSTYYYKKALWVNCYAYAIKGLSIFDKPIDYLVESHAWGYHLHDMAAISSYHLGKFDEAIVHGEIALSMDKTNERLANNLKEYKKDR